MKSMTLGINDPKNRVMIDAYYHKHDLTNKSKREKVNFLIKQFGYENLACSNGVVTEEKELLSMEMVLLSEIS